MHRLAKKSCGPLVYSTLKYEFIQAAPLKGRAAEMSSLSYVEKVILELRGGKENYILSRTDDIALNMSHFIFIPYIALCIPRYNGRFKMFLTLRQKN